MTHAWNSLPNKFDHIINEAHVLIFCLFMDICGYNRINNILNIKLIIAVNICDFKAPILVFFILHRRASKILLVVLDLCAVFDKKFIFPLFVKKKGRLFT